MPQRPTKLSPLTKLAIAALEDLKGVNIQVLDVKKLTAMTDAMVICTGTSNRHVKSLADNVLKAAKEAGETPRGVQGLEVGEWVLVDLIEVIVHVMLLPTRAHYQLEKLWDLAPEPAPAARSKPKAKSTAKTKAKPKSKAKPVKSAAKSKKTASKRRR